MCLADADGIPEMGCTVCTWRGSLGQAKESVLLGPNLFKCPQCGHEIKEAPAPPMIAEVYEVDGDALRTTEIVLSLEGIAKKPEQEL